MPLPGVVGLVASTAATVLATFGGKPLAAIATGTALILLLSWMVFYLRISAPINRALIAATSEGITPADTRQLQAQWDSIIPLRATLQGLALLVLAISLLAT